jgi:hypothetical protein
MPDHNDPVLLLREAPVDERRLAAVRRRVLDSVGRRSWPGRWALAGALASGTFLAFHWAPRPMSLEPPAITANLPKPPEWALSPVVRVVQTSFPARRRLLPAQASPAKVQLLAVQSAPSEGEPDTAVLEIQTSNPDVVLYWLVDSGGD